MLFDFLKMAPSRFFHAHCLLDKIADIIAEIQCKSLSSVANGNIETMSTECGGKAEFSCHRYHNLVGSARIICDENGNWSDKIPYCERKLKSICW